MRLAGPPCRIYRLSETIPSQKAQVRRLNSVSTVLNVPKADIYRFGDANRATPVFHDVEWSIKATDSWAVVGTGSGEKSSVFDMLMGHLRIHPPPPPPGGLFPFLANESRDPHDCVSIVSFANKRVAGGAFYDYTARYGAVREEDRITLRESMFPETINDLKSQTRIALEPVSTDHKLFDYLAERMGLQSLLDLPRIALSNGQTRRARILKALLAKPRLLLLDEPLTGLDVENRATVLAILHELHAACNPHIVIGLRMQDAVPEWVTHLAIVNEGQIKSGPKAQLLAYKTKIQNATALRGEQVPHIKLDPNAGEPVVEMKNVCVTYGPRQVLKSITWTIRKGQRYHLQGTNGSGKTTLLSLLTGDHPQSYTQLGGPSDSRYLRLFGLPRARLATPHLQARIGVVTPELFDAFPRRAPGMSVWEAIGTGFEGGFVPKGQDGVGIGLSEDEREWRIRRCWEVLEALGPTAWRSPSSPTSIPQPPTSSSSSSSSKIPSPSTPSSTSPTLHQFASLKFPDLPVAAQRMVLLMRALVAQPPVVLLDEVWSGMDAGMVAAAHAYLRTGGGVGKEQAVVVVTHLEDEVPWDERDGVVRVLLKDGELSGAGEV
ncbi:p-loop containing nucleoside triphosphate hydrolase protein [Favolaschia claudopus]|uniref:P-loop containing nucleoside triphosphate hydrolase protein n=1 Tax=Favolaschia claudopus TaxID=2862362 RepID=A0AAW0DYK7_9AGAR